MTDHFLFLIVGLGSGAVYAALALGLIVVFKGTGTINFAQGAMAMTAAYVYDELRKTGTLVLPVGELQVGSGFLVALVIGVVASALLGAAAHLIVFRPLRTAPPLAKVVASIGLMSFVQAAVVLRFSADQRSVAPILPNEPMSIAGVTFARDRVYLTVTVVALGVVLWLLFRYTRYGLATRAAAENERAATLHGLSPDLLACGAWVLSSAVTGLVAILASPSTGLRPTSFTLLIVPALAVALLARLQSLAIGCVAGLMLGAAQSELSYLSTRDWWPSWAAVGITDAVPFLLVVLVLFFVGRDLPVRGSVSAEPLPPVIRSRNRPSTVALVTCAAAAALVLSSGSYRFGLVTSMIAATIMLSFVVLTGLVGQISLAQAAIAGTAGFVLSRATTTWGVPFPLSVLVSALAATLVGTLVGVPALRVRGAQLAVVTLAGAVAVEKFVFRNPSFTSQAGNQIADPSFLGVDLAVRSSGDLTRLPFSLMVLAVLVGMAVAVGNLTRSATGNAFMAVRSNERAAAAVGINVAETKLVAFALSSFLAGVGGCLLGYSRGLLSAESFSVFVGLSLLLSAYLGGITSVSGALVGGLFAPLGIVYVFLSRNVDLGDHYPLLLSVALIYTVVSNPTGIAGTFRDRAAERRRPAQRSTTPRLWSATAPGPEAP